MSKTAKNFNKYKIQTSKILDSKNNIINQFRNYLEIQSKLENLFLKEDKRKVLNLKSKSGIVLLFNNNQCNSCVKSIVMDFCYLKENTSYSNFILLGSFKKEFEYFDFVNGIDNEFKHMNLFESDYEILSMFEFPIIFVVEKNIGVKYIFCPDLMPEKREWYILDFLMKYCTSN